MVGKEGPEDGAREIRACLRVNVTVIRCPSGLSPVTVATASSERLGC